MARIFITGSADSLGQMATALLIKTGHQVVLHARNVNRTKDARSSVPGAEGRITGDLSNVADTINVANPVNRLGLFDAVIHNAGVDTGSPIVLKQQMVYRRYLP